jgi:hypothetical protein
VQGPYGSVTSPTQLGSHPNCVVGSRLYYAGTLCQAIRACTDVASPSPIRVDETMTYDYVVTIRVADRKISGDVSQSVSVY